MGASVSQRIGSVLCAVTCRGVSTPLLAAGNEFGIPAWMIFCVEGALSASSGMMHVSFPRSHCANPITTARCSLPATRSSTMASASSSRYGGWDCALCSDCCLCLGVRVKETTRVSWLVYPRGTARAVVALHDGVPWRMMSMSCFSTGAGRRFRSVWTTDDRLGQGSVSLLPTRYTLRPAPQAHTGPQPFPAFLRHRPRTDGHRHVPALLVIGAAHPSTPHCALPAAPPPLVINARGPSSPSSSSHILTLHATRATRAAPLTLSAALRSSSRAMHSRLSLAAPGALPTAFRHISAHGRRAPPARLVVLRCLVPVADSHRPVPPAAARIACGLPRRSSIRRVRPTTPIRIVVVRAVGASPPPFPVADIIGSPSTPCVGPDPPLRASPTVTHQCFPPILDCAPECRHALDSSSTLRGAPSSLLRSCLQHAPPFLAAARRTRASQPPSYRRRSAFPCPRPSRARPVLARRRNSVLTLPCRTGGILSGATGSGTMLLGDDTESTRVRPSSLV
ncbi:hypothetical protein C8R47DRAFT_803264 [Mycena vitilis]|nr:hypothetical protein C8R47DRAFT_803264 [Mycena vitilis]